MLEPPKQSRHSRSGLFACLAFAAMTIVLAACSGTTGGLPGLGSASNPAAETAAALASMPEPGNKFVIRLEAGDKLQVTVFGEDKLSGTYTVDTSGNLALPLAGTVKAAGLTAPELEKVLEKAFGGTYLRSPKVTVEVLTFRPFYVLGEVQKPGEYPYRAGLNVLSAIAIAGGATYRASTGEVMIQRAGTTALQKFPQSPTVQIMPGDLIRVPERFF